MPPPIDALPAPDDVVPPPLVGLPELPPVAVPEAQSDKQLENRQAATSVVAFWHADDVALALQSALQKAPYCEAQLFWTQAWQAAESVPCGGVELQFDVEGVLELLLEDPLPHAQSSVPDASSSSQ